MSRKYMSITYDFPDSRYIQSAGQTGKELKAEVDEFIDRNIQQLFSNEGSSNIRINLNQARSMVMPGGAMNKTFKSLANWMNRASTHYEQNDISYVGWMILRESSGATIKTVENKVKDVLNNLNQYSQNSKTAGNEWNTVWYSDFVQQGRGAGWT